MTTTPTSGAADLPEALINIAREIEALKRDCGMDPESAIAIQNGRYMAISYKVRALAAGQATAAPVLWLSPEQFANFVDADEAPFGKYVPARKTSAGKFTMPLFAARAPAPAQPAAQQGAAYAALPKGESAAPQLRAMATNYPVGHLWDKLDAKACIRGALEIEALRASHGQAPAGATKPTEQQILEAAEKAGLWPNTVRSWIPAFHRYHKELAKAQPAPARADSVLEDAARYRHLRDCNSGSLAVMQITGTDEDDWFILTEDDADAAIDAAMNKGGSA